MNRKCQELWNDFIRQIESKMNLMLVEFGGSALSTGTGALSAVVTGRSKSVINEQVCTQK